MSAVKATTTATLYPDQWHTLLRAVALAEKGVDGLAKADGWRDGEAAMAKAEYSMLFTELFKQAPSSVRSALLNNAVRKDKPND